MIAPQNKMKYSLHCIEIYNADPDTNIQILQIHSGKTRWLGASIFIKCHGQTCWNVSSRSYSWFLTQNKTCTFEYAAPKGSVPWCTGKRHIFGGCCEESIYIYIWLVDLIGWFTKSQFYPIKALCNLLSKFYIFKGRNNPQLPHTSQVHSTGQNSTNSEPQAPPPLGVYGP
jgi:hypothetical protein